ncbi:MAG TPA: DNA-3-methyladenine glycosylase 2 family protein [Methanocorpusculum sp.]|nr:DNA-3-methyladenine glycosylase 2 family protein [Methanocorpusculum sp.]
MRYFPYGPIETDALKKADPILGSAIEQLGHPNRPLIPDMFTALIHYVIAQQISTKAAKTVMNRIINRCEGNITPKKMMEFSKEDIQAFGISWKKADYIQEIAFAFISGKINTRELQNSEEKQIIQTLTALPGIGIWTVEMLMLHSLQRPNICSWTDLGIRRGIMRLYGIKTISKTEFEKLRRHYTPYGSVASIYLWEVAHQEEYKNKIY